MDGRADGYLPRDPRSGAIGPDTSAVVYAMLPGWWVCRRWLRVARSLLAPQRERSKKPVPDDWNYCVAFAYFCSEDPWAVLQ